MSLLLLFNGARRTDAPGRVVFTSPIVRRRVFPVTRAETIISERIHVGDVGTGLVVQIVEWDEETQTWVAVDISDATALTIYLTRPSGTTLTKTAALDSDGTDGMLRYDTISGDLSAAGTWRIQGYAAGVDGWSGSSREFTFSVFTSRHGV